MKKNLYQNIPIDLPEELVSILVSSSKFRLERIVSRGHASPTGFWYEQPEHEWVLLLSGSTVLCFRDDDDRIDLRPGDFINIRVGRQHRVEQTAADINTVWLALFYTS